MSPTTRSFLAILAIVLCAVISGGTYVNADREVHQKIDWYYGSWIGWTDGTVHHFRLDLRPDGTGVYAYLLSIAREPTIYEIDEWEISNDGLLVVTFSPKNTGENIELIGEMTPGGGIGMQVRGIDNDWSRDVQLLHKKEIDTGQEKIENALKSFIKSGP